MARISLRAYNRDIEVMVDKNQIDEAFAHCRYILQLYPKHINTYRLMGKALLEAQRFSDAADVFHRVLSSIPDDFIAHLGMSIIREDESNLDAAIWHMERSFEVQPSNAAVQVELRRLYGLRDGVTPQKIQLTRGALARMSAKSNLHSQAIAELRAALSNDPQRPDLQVVLADMYQQTGAHMEAIETCNALINKLPYCLTANRILAELLPKTERADQSHVYKTRMAELDPYYSQISPVAPTLDQVPDGAVTIERFEYTGESYAATEQEQPAWAASLGVDLEEQDEEGEPAPDWLAESEAESESEQTETPDEDLGLTPEFEATQESEDLPDWMAEMSEADKEPASLPEDEEPVVLADGDSEIEETWAVDSQPEAAQGVEQIPDWMDDGEAEIEEEAESAHFEAAAAGAGAAAVGAFITSQDEGEDELQAETEPEFEPEQADQPAQDTAAPLPTWMQEAGVLEEEAFQADSQSAEPELASEEEPSKLGPPDEEESAAVPDWMSESAVEETETPDWLKNAMESTDDEEMSGTPPAAALAAAGAAIGAHDEDEIDEEIPADTDEEQFIETGEAGESEEQPEEDQVSAGEAALAGAAGAVLGAVLDSDADEPESGVEEDIPEWLTDLGEDLPEPEHEAVPAAIFEEQPIGDEEPEEATAGVQAAGDDEDLEFIAEDEDLVAAGIASQLGEESEDREFPESIPDWLSEVSPDEIPAEVLEAESEFDIVRAEIPIWLKKMEAEHQAEIAAEAEVDRIEDIELESEFTQLSGEDVPTWLMSAMEPELSEAGVAPEGVDDISAVFEEIEAVEVDELGLAAAEIGEQAADEPSAETSFEDMEAELQPVDIVDALEDQEIKEPLESLVEEAPAEELLSLEEQDEQVEDIEAEGLSMTELAAAAAAGAVAAHFVEDEEDTQPVVVREEAELSSVQDTEEAMEEALAEEEGELVEAADDFTEPLEAAPEDELLAPTEADMAETPAFAADEPLSTEEEDAAMAWLESLAAKQGAAEEELLTPADQRLEQPPEWVQEEISEFEGEEDEDETRQTALTAAALAGMTAGLLDKDEPVAEEEAQADLEEVIEEPSEWVPEIIAEETTDLAEQAEAIEEQVAPVPESMEMDEEPDFIDELAAAAEVDLDQVETQETPGEIPGWLSGLAEDQEYVTPSEDIEWTPGMVVEDVGETGEMVASEEVQKLDINAASLSQLEKIPGIGFITAQNIINHRSTHGSFTDLEQLSEIEDLSPDMVADLEEYLTIAVVAEVMTTESEAPWIQQAWEQIDQGNIDEAVGKYNELIGAGQHLDEVIRDLQSALNKYPRDSSLYQTLGDAYMRTNMLQEALDAYNRAEDFI